MKPEGKTFRKKVLPLLSHSIKSYIAKYWEEYSKDSKKIYEFNREIRHKLDQSDIYTICAKLNILKKCTYQTYLILRTKNKNQLCDLQRNALSSFFSRGSFKNFRRNFGKYSFKENNQARNNVYLYKRRGSFGGFR